MASEAEKTMNFDVIVVGGGMIGASTALELVRRNFKVGLIERSSCLAEPEPGRIERRVSAISPLSQSALAQLDSWQNIELNNLCAYKKIEVCDQNTDQQLHFNAHDIHESELGHIIENDRITHVLQQQLFKRDVPCFFNLTIDHIQRIDDRRKWRLELSDGQVVFCDLIAAADGGLSSIRQYFGFGCIERPYQHTAIVATIETEYSHQQTAYQRFLKNGVLAFLPLRNSNRCSIVWSLSTSDAKRHMNQDASRFLNALNQDFNHRLGELSLLSPVMSFPLIERHVDQYYQDGVVLIGDAAHTIHPLAGQGVNLGFRDVIALCQTLSEAKEQHRDFSHASTLARFERIRRQDNSMMILSMRGFKELFCNDNPLYAAVRGWGIDKVNKTVWLKRFFMYEAMGKSLKGQRR
ncbi:MAG: UbiH/UbiF/VisC/COQ6 family ubiquinone biosynthesis hydroxylase [Francisellaceae bacterium]